MAGALHGCSACPGRVGHTEHQPPLVLGPASGATSLFPIFTGCDLSPELEVLQS